MLPASQKPLYKIHKSSISSYFFQLTWSLLHIQHRLRIEERLSSFSIAHCIVFVLSELEPQFSNIDLHFAFQVYFISQQALSHREKAIWHTNIQVFSMMEVALNSTSMKALQLLPSLPIFVQVQQGYPHKPQDGILVFQHMIQWVQQFQNDSESQYQ